MQSSSSTALVTADDLRAAAADLVKAEHHIARAVLALGRIAGTGTCERVEGLPLDLFIGLACRLTGADRAVLIGAGQVLAQMPATASLFESGAISWGQVRRIVKAARTLRVAQRAELDEQIAASAERYSGIDAFGPDQLCEAVDAAADALRLPRSIEKREAAAAQANFLSVQRTLFNRVQFFGDYDESSAAPIVDMLDAQAGQPHGCGPAEAADAPATEDAPAPAEEAPAATRRGGHYARALHDIAAAYLAGGLGAKRARNLVNVHVDTSQISVNNAGVIELNVRGPLPRISLAALEILSKDADCRVVLFDGKRPLAVSKKLHAKDIPADVAFAVGARDLGCRFPGSTDPLGFTDNHHIKQRARGGVHHVDDLVRLSRRFHTTGHDHGWTMKLDPADGMFTITRGNRTWRSLPRGTPLARPGSSRPPNGGDDTANRRRDRSRAKVSRDNPPSADLPLPF